ncbi:MAG TPA: hypothetical protein VKB71_08565 [Rhizomicrobium sp.]|nr:hypothetical protein [Rhizomicrobium sp.]
MSYVVARLEEALTTAQLHAFKRGRKLIDSSVRQQIEYLICRDSALRKRHRGEARPMGLRDDHGLESLAPKDN